MFKTPVEWKSRVTHDSFITQQTRREKFEQSDEVADEVLI